MLNPAVKVLKLMYSFVIKLIVAAGIFPFQSCQNIG